MCSICYSGSLQIGNFRRTLSHLLPKRSCICLWNKSRIDRSSAEQILWTRITMVQPHNCCFKCIWWSASVICWSNSHRFAASIILWISQVFVRPKLPSPAFFYDWKQGGTLHFVFHNRSEILEVHSKQQQMQWTKNWKINDDRKHQNHGQASQNGLYRSSFKGILVQRGVQCF